MSRPTLYYDDGQAYCRVFWGSHGCEYAFGHAGPHGCDCCECDDHERDHEAEGCVAKPPYYGPETSFYGEDVGVTTYYDDGAAKK